MTKSPLPTVDVLRQLLRYEAGTGKLFWLPRNSGCTADKIFNSRFAGKEAFTALTTYGYRQGVVLQCHLLAHRVVWALVHGAWPSQMIDHIDGDPSNNRLENLRDVGGSDNQRNRKINRNNKTGVLGVKWRSDRNKFIVEIRANGKCVRVGSFESLADAAAARKHAEEFYGYNKNHGRKA